jgi:hypothetical protein
MKVLTFIVVGGAVVLGGKYLLSLKRAEQKVVIVPRVKKDKITIKGISLKLFYNIKNPTNAFMRMAPPLIKISVNGSLLTSSNMKLIEIPQEVRDPSGKISIRPFKETGEIETLVFIPWSTLALISPDLITRLKSDDKKDKLAVEIETLSQVFTPLGNFPYESTQKLKI